VDEALRRGWLPLATQKPFECLARNQVPPAVSGPERNTGKLPSADRVPDQCWGNAEDLSSLVC
jgi:hypothetical protein